MVTDVRFQYTTPLHKIDTEGHNHRDVDKGGRSFGHASRLLDQMRQIHAVTQVL